MQNARASEQTGTDPQLGEFYIQASPSLTDRQRSALKHGNTFVIFDQCGDISTEGSSPEGLFHEDTRHLSRFEVRIDGDRPMLLSSMVRNDAVLITDLTNPDLRRNGRLVRERDRLHIRETIFLWKGTEYGRLSIRNFDVQTQEFALTFDFEADFADLFEVRGHPRKRRGKTEAAVSGPNTVCFRYLGLDNRVRKTEVRFDPQPSSLGTGAATYRLSLRPYERRSIYIRIDCDPEASDGVDKRFLAALRDSGRALRRSKGRAAAIETSNETVNEILNRSVDDLYMLVTDTPEGPYPYAGIPWFSTVFGRDGIIAALESLWVDPEIARGVLRFLAAHQAHEADPESDAEPGKILHEMREGEMALLGEVPFHLYYGSVDSTPLFVMLAGAYFERTGDLETTRSLWPAIDAALHWIDAYGDQDKDGFVEYARMTDKGLANQGWKDSQDSIFHADGRLAEGPIALCEVQAYVYAAKRAGSTIAAALGMATRAATLDGQAKDLRERFDTAFWCDDLDTYALALDGSKRQCRVRSSNAGQTLMTGIVLPERAPRLVKTLMSQQSFSGWGVRTLASGQARYNPMSYHDGSVWPHDNALIAMGLARYGFKDETLRIVSGLFDAAACMDLRRLPELFCGFPRKQQKGPTHYPVACSPQAWAAAAPLFLIQAAIGLQFDPSANEIRFDRPSLPHFIDQVRLRRLRLGNTCLDLDLRQYNGGVVVNVANRHGDALVITAA